MVDAIDTSGAALCVFFAAVLLRSCVSLHGYSGEGVPPMYGDFEAQRHWMEVTVNLPPRAWYVHGADNDLQYWGLDYPPLSAYLSWLLGLVACWCGLPQLVALHDSRGHESEASRLFMRRSVLACDVLLFMPAAWACAAAGAPKGPARLGLLALLCALPPLVLVDHG
jgi:alpha-1,3-glucosyltransferase